MAVSSSITPETLLAQARQNPLCQNAIRIIDDEYERLKDTPDVRQRLVLKATEKINQGSRTVAGMWELAEGNILLTLEQSMSELMVITEAKRNLSIIGMLMYERAINLTKTATKTTTTTATKTKTATRTRTATRTKVKSQVLTEHTYTYRWQKQHPGRIIILYQTLLRLGYIAPDTTPEAFDAIFSGELSTARVRWMKSQSWLWYILRRMVEEGHLKIDASTSIWLIASSHFLNAKGQLYTNVSFSKLKDPKKQVTILDQIVEILNAAVKLKPINIMDDDPDAETWAGIKDKGFEM